MATAGIAASLPRWARRCRDPAAVWHHRDVPVTLVTGADSLVGAHLARLLAERGDDRGQLLAGQPDEVAPAGVLRRREGLGVGGGDG